jgi:thioredoxin-related protein
VPLVPAESEHKGIHPEALEEAVSEARKEGKYLYVAFLGEGWSLSCKRFKATILESSSFKQFSEENLVYLPVEARRKPKLTPGEVAVLQSWVIHFDVKAYPTLIIIAPDGEELLRHGYRDLTPEAYIELLNNILPDLTN